MTLKIFRKFGAALAGLFIFSIHGADASEYIFRDLLGNTFSTKSCAIKQDAEKKATETYIINKFTKRFCETQGYGWYLSEQKSPGNLICKPCDAEGKAGQFRCHVEDILVACKRLKPGTAGLIPGES